MMKLLSQSLLKLSFLGCRIILQLLCLDCLWTLLYLLVRFVLEHCWLSNAGYLLYFLMLCFYVFLLAYLYLKISPCVHSCSAYRRSWQQEQRWHQRSSHEPVVYEFLRGRWAIKTCCSPAAGHYICFGNLQWFVNCIVVNLLVEVMALSHFS